MSGKRYGRRDFQRDMREQRAKPDPQQATDEHLRQLTFALFRKMGRVRIPAADVAALDPRDKVSFQTDNATGDIIITYESAPSEEPGAAPKIAMDSH